MFSRRSVLKTFGGAILGALGFAGYGFAVEPGWRLATARYRLRIAGFAPDRPLKIGVISDLHASEPQMGLKRIQDVVDRVNGLEPDVIVLLGDYGVGQTIYARAVPHGLLSPVLAGLKAPLGVFGILGNHDYWGSSLRDWPYTPEKVADYANGYRAMLNAAGIRVLENEALRLSHRDQPFWLAGTGSAIALPIGRRRFISYARLDKVLPQLTDDAPAILMAHEPDLFVQVPQRIALTLSGHTHGGQVRLLGWSPITPSDYGNRFAYGHVVENGRNLIVSGGLGTSMLPVRFGVPPEVGLVEIG